MVFPEARDVKQTYVGSEDMSSITGLTKEYGVTCCSEKCAERSHRSAAFVLIAQVGGKDVENEGACIRRHPIMTRKSREARSTSG